MIASFCFNLLIFAERFNFYIDIKLFFIAFYERKNVSYGHVSCSLPTKRERIIAQDTMILRFQIGAFKKKKLH